MNYATGRRRLRARRRHQLLHPRPHVRLLLPRRAGAARAEVPLVEEVPHQAAGMDPFTFVFSKLAHISINGYKMCTF